jgi:TIR domain
MDRDFYVTCSGADVRWAEWIAAELEAAGHTTILQTWDFRPGDNFMAAMDHAVATCHHTIGVLSPGYLRSVFTTAEWTAAYQRTLLGKDRAFIPVRVERCEVRGLLGPIAYVDLVGVSEDEARRRLIDAVAEQVPRRPGKPGFPGATK